MKQGETIFILVDFDQNEIAGFVKMLDEGTNKTAFAIDGNMYTVEIGDCGNHVDKVIIRKKK